MPRRRWLIALGAGAAVLLIVGRGFAQLYADYAWYASLGALEVWRAKYSSLLALRLFCGTAATVFAFVNLYAVRQSVVSLVLPRRIGNLDIGEEVPRRQLTWTAAALALVIGLAFAWMWQDWSAYLAARIGQPFGESDPYFATDLGFFVYRLPFELSLFTWTMTMVLLVVGLVLLLYALTPSLRWEQGRMYVSGYVRRHMTMLAGVLLLVLAWHYRLDMYTVLGAGSAPDGAFTAVDHRVGIPASLLLSLATLGAGLTVLWAGWTGQLRLAFAALTGVILATVSARQIAPFIAARAMSDTDPAVRERPYQATRAGYTRRAFAVDRIIVSDSLVPFASLAEAAPHVPLWDGGALLRVSERAVSGSDVGWWTTDSGIVAIVPTLGASVGFIAFQASDAEESGAPVRVPRLDAHGSFAPVLVLADSAAPAILIADSTGQLAAPALGSTLSRFAHALALQDLRVWLGALPSPSPKLISRRGVRERIHALAPFFAQGSAVAPVWFADSLAWAVELYSASANYPLSRKSRIAGRERSYFQHAATAIVNATTGRAVFVADSLPDPIAATWMARLPKLFARASSLPLSIRRQLPPARDAARAQAYAFGRFGTRDETDIVRHLPVDDGADSALASTAPPETAFPHLGTTGLVLPLLDRDERLRGVLVALGGPSHRTIWQAIDDSGPIWTEALDELRAADTVSASLLVRGYVRVVPMRGAVALAQPRYDWRSGSAPRLLYVSAILADSVRSSKTLLQLAGGLPGGDSTPAADFLTRVRALYDEMRRASGRGDWSAYGRAFNGLGTLLHENPRP